MQMENTERVPAPQDQAWEALNNPEILKACIPGCESLTMTTPTDMVATVVVKVGPVKAKFSGKVTLSDLDPPNGYRITGEGSGGVAGFAKGGATVRLTPEGPSETALHYIVDVQIGGKLAQLGSRLIDATAKKLSSEFFQAFAAAVAQSQAATEPAGPTVAVETQSAEAETVPADGSKSWLSRLIARK
jgi:carbon monoxide dehydrogenase subunit G